MRAICVTDGTAVLSAHIGKNCRVIAKCVAPFPLFLLLLVGLVAVFFRLWWHISHLEYTAEHNKQVCLDSNQLHNNFRSYKDWGDPYQGSFFASFYSTILFLIHRPNKIQKRLHKKKRQFGRSCCDYKDKVNLKYKTVNQNVIMLHNYLVSIYILFFWTCPVFKYREVNCLLFGWETM